MTPRSRFAYGSVSKVFTAALVMQLVEEGEAELDEPVLSFLSGHTVPPGHPMRSVTLRHLLSHTAGLVSDYEGAPLRSPSLHRYFASVLRAGHFSAPGSAFSYSNTGYAVAAYAVEVLTGQSWWDSVESYLARPTGLDLAFVRDPRPGAAPPAIVSGHAVTATTGKSSPVDFHVESTLVPAGGIAGSAMDLVRFGRCFLGEGHADLEADIAALDVLAQMGHSVPEADPFGIAAGWGAGWGLFPADDGTLWLGHDGTLDGGSCNVRVSPDGGTALAFTTNSTTGLAAWEDLVAELDRSFGLRVGHYRQPAPDDRPYDSTALLAGEFLNGDLDIQVSLGDGNTLRFAACNGISGDLAVGSDLTFAVRAADQGDLLFSGRFMSSVPDGPVDLMQYNGRTLFKDSSQARLVA
ncbi:serine hydrolase domain-containing protein [Streptomyces enissocaesilis]|uniref:Serine hydrolase domain-containing protein n=1 Tax=Streptomyces enissocaesilis TaxID=332589 RepID=A0ABN3WZ06_9ACTN